MYKPGEKFELKEKLIGNAEIISVYPGGQNKKETEYKVVMAGGTFVVKEEFFDLIFTKISEIDPIVLVMENLAVLSSDVATAESVLYEGLNSIAGNSGEDLTSEDNFSDEDEECLEIVEAHSNSTPSEETIPLVRGPGRPRRVANEN